MRSNSRAWPMVSCVCRYMMPGSRMTERSSLGHSSATSTWFSSCTIRSAFSAKKGWSIDSQPGENLGDELFDLAAFRVQEHDLLADEGQAADALEYTFLVQLGVHFLK